MQYTVQVTRESYAGRAWGDFMAKVLVSYYSSYGHVETMAQAAADGARSGGAARFQGRLVAETAKKLFG